MPHIYKETNKKKLGKNNNEMESNTIKITHKQNTSKKAKKNKGRKTVRIASKEREHKTV